MDKFMKDIRIEEIGKIWEKLHGMYCEDCDGSCTGCPVQKAIDAVTELELYEDDCPYGR